MTTYTGKPGPGLLIAEQTIADAVVLSARGDIDMMTAPQLQLHVDRVLEGQPSALIMDLLRVDFLGSAGIGVLVHAHNTVGQTRYAVVATGPATRRPLHLLAIDQYVAVYSTVREALDGLGMTRSDAG